MNESWDQYFLDMLETVRAKSKDRSRKTGAIIVDSETKAILSTGYNGFPIHVDDTIEERHERPAKYQWTEHAERNAIYLAARRGICLEAATMYINWYPCADCARGIIQSGILEIRCLEPDWNDPKWGSDFRMVKEMLTEAGVQTTFLGQHTEKAS